MTDVDPLGGQITVSNHKQITCKRSFSGTSLYCGFDGLTLTAIQTEQQHNPTLLIFV